MPISKGRPIKLHTRPALDSPPHMPMTAQEFLKADPDHLTPAELAAVAEHMLADEIPCHYCGKWMPRAYDWEYFEFGVQICDACEAKFQQSKRPLSDVGKG